MTGYAMPRFPYLVTKIALALSWAAGGKPSELSNIMPEIREAEQFLATYRRLEWGLKNMAEHKE